ncbi:MAG: hypothetical protein R2860_16575 [Desulfobacterales bacterium]
MADGGSGGRTQEIASQAGATVLQSRVGRAVQMNYGCYAKGDIFVFLHADSLSCYRGGIIRFVVS